MVPVTGLEGAPPLAELLVSELRAQQGLKFQARDVLAFDLMTYDTQPSVCSGVRGEFIHAPRLDNLASCHAAITALTSTTEPLPAFTRVVVLYDHEEVGSQSVQGAGGSLLPGVLERAVSGFKDGGRQGLARALARSSMVSAAEDITCPLSVTASLAGNRKRTVWPT